MKRFLALLIAFTTLMGLFTIGFAEEDYSIEERNYDTVMQLIELFAISEKSDSQILEEALLSIAEGSREDLYKVLDAIAKTVDEYSCYYSPEEYEAFSKSLSGTVCGIGVTAVVENGAFTVVTLLDGGSAKEGGIEAGDKIIEADGVDITGEKAENASSYITGEQGTYVTIKVKKANGEIKEYTLQRRVVIVPSIAGEILEDDGIGYILINSFTENTHTEVEKLLKEFKEKGIEKLIVDLRYNGGGVMDSGIASAELFMEKDKVIISTKGKESEEHTYYKSSKDGYKFKTVLLTNEYTASAAEIFACALIDNGYAQSVGNTTYGKACAQGLYPIGIGGALRLTVLNYYTPKGNFINKTGIPATYNVANKTYKLTEDELPRLSFTHKFNLGDIHEDVEKIEEMLYTLKYLDENPDNVYSEVTKKAVADYQLAVGLFPYGVCDMTTQSYLVNSYSEVEFTEDTQLEYAKQILK